MINVVCGIRSTGRICTDLASALEAQGHEVKIAYGRENVPAEFQKYAVRIGSDFDVKIHGLKARLFDAAGFGSKRATKKFIKWVREYDPDVIHLHNIHGYYINIEVLFTYLKTCGKKIIWTLHDCWAFTGHCSHFSYVKCYKWKTECNHCIQKKEYPCSMLFDLSKKNWNNKKRAFEGVPNLTIVTPSKWLADLVGESFLAEYRTKVVHNGIDTEVFKPTESLFREKNGLQEKKMLLGVASAWNHRKGLQEFVKLSELLNSEYRIVLVGLTREQIQDLPREIMGIERTNSVRELAEIYSAADVFVNLSVEETFGMTTVEAISCGTPVIVYKMTAMSELVTDECGVKIDYGLSNLSVERIDELLHLSIQKRNSMRPFQQQYSKATMISEYISLYGKV